MERSERELLCETLLKFRGINARIQNILEYHYEQAIREIQFEVDDLQKRHESDPEFPGNLFAAIMSQMEENWNWDFSNYDTQDEKDESFARQISRYFE